MEYEYSLGVDASEKRRKDGELVIGSIQSSCGKCPCPPCTHQVEKVPLDCGHGFLATCSSNFDHIRCEEPLMLSKHDYGHLKTIRCFEKDLADVCKVRCTSHTFPYSHRTPDQSLRAADMGLLTSR